MFVVVPLGVAGVLIGLPFVLPARLASFTFLLPIFVIAVIGLVHGFTLPEDYLAKWGKAHGLTITPQNRPIIRRYLLRGRRIRAAGAVLGYVSFGIYDFYSRGAELPFGWVTATFAGYLLGAGAAEVWAMRPERDSVRTASLAPREITDYVPRWAVIGVRVVPVATVIAAALWPIMPDGPAPAARIEPQPDLGSIIVWAVGSVVLALFVGATARRCVTRPQPAGSEELVTVDDAIRSTALHGLHGAGLALILGAFSRTLSELQHFSFGANRLQGLLVVLAVLSGVAAPFVWLHLGIDQPWVVRRGGRQPQVAA
jgi:hypothetical protein